MVSHLIVILEICHSITVQHVADHSGKRVYEITVATERTPSLRFHALHTTYHRIYEKLIFEPSDHA